MNMEKKVYETPVVTKVEYDTSDRITASQCYYPVPAFAGDGISECAN